MLRRGVSFSAFPNEISDPMQSTSGYQPGILSTDLRSVIPSPAFALPVPSCTHMVSDSSFSTRSFSLHFTPPGDVAFPVESTTLGRSPPVPAPRDSSVTRLQTPILDLSGLPDLSIPVPAELLSASPDLAFQDVLSGGEPNFFQHVLGTQREMLGSSSVAQLQVSPDRSVLPLGDSVVYVSRDSDVRRPGLQVQSPSASLLPRKEKATMPMSRGLSTPGRRSALTASSGVPRMRSTDGVLPVSPSPSRVRFAPEPMVDSSSDLLTFSPPNPGSLGRDNLGLPPASPSEDVIEEDLQYLQLPGWPPLIPISWVIEEMWFPSEDSSAHLVRSSSGLPLLRRRFKRGIHFLFS